MKILITGIAGTGKSTISKALNERGILSIDFSEVEGMCYWRNLNSKENVQYSSTPADCNWLKTHERICDIEILKGVLGQHENIVMAGVASDNQKEYFVLFDKVFLLQCSPDTVRYRIQTRVPEWGKTKAAQDSVVAWQKDFEPTLLAQGAIPIHAEGNLHDVLDDIISRI